MGELLVAKKQNTQNTAVDDNCNGHPVTQNTVSDDNGINLQTTKNDYADKKITPITTGPISTKVNYDIWYKTDRAVRIPINGLVS